jgi:hypothetical protein
MSCRTVRPLPLQTSTTHVGSGTVTSVADRADGPSSPLSCKGFRARRTRKCVRCGKFARFEPGRAVCSLCLGHLPLIYPKAG